MNAKFPQINNVVRRGTQMVPKLQRPSNVNKEYHYPDGNGSRDGCGVGRLDPGEFVINARICTAGPDNVQHCNVMNP